MTDRQTDIKKKDRPSFTQWQTGRQTDIQSGSQTDIKVEKNKE